MLIRLVKHPNILKFIDIFESQNRLFVILEYAEQGELFDYLVSRRFLCADQALEFFRQIIFAIEYLHLHGICHRDLKPENILLDETMRIKIADFGFARWSTTELLTDPCGSPHYAAPELLSGKPYAGKAADVWSVGIILFALLSGYLPFDDYSPSRLVQKIKRGYFSIPEFNPIIKDLIKRMLTVDPATRITIPEIKQHPCFRWKLDDDYILPRPLGIMFDESNSESDSTNVNNKNNRNSNVENSISNVYNNNNNVDNNIVTNNDANNNNVTNIAILLSPEVLQVVDRICSLSHDQFIEELKSPTNNLPKVIVSMLSPHLDLEQLPWDSPESHHAPKQLGDLSIMDSYQHVASDDRLHMDSTDPFHRHSADPNKVNLSTDSTSTTTSTTTSDVEKFSSTVFESTSNSNSNAIANANEIGNESENIIIMMKNSMVSKPKWDMEQSVDSEVLAKFDFETNGIELWKLMMEIQKIMNKETTEVQWFHPDPMHFYIRGSGGAFFAEIEAKCVQNNIKEKLMISSAIYLRKGEFDPFAIFCTHLINDIENLSSNKVK